VSKAFDKDGSVETLIEEIMFISKKILNNFNKTVFENMCKQSNANGESEIEFKDFKLIMHGFFKYNVPSQ
jgi:Ca2+-binding EF-hand superfamily protein